MVLFSVYNVYLHETSLHTIISLYLLLGGFALFALAVSRRRGPPGTAGEDASGLVKALDKLGGAKPFGFTTLAISPLPLGFGLAGFVVFLMLYVVSVNAMRTTDEELRSWVFPKEEKIE